MSIQRDIALTNDASIISKQESSSTNEEAKEVRSEGTQSRAW
jgi:hypothetical protein